MNLQTGLRPLVLFAVAVLSVLPAFAADKAEFQAPDIDGRMHSLSDYQGKWVLVNYWATWCPPCLEELPELEVFHTTSEGRAVVLGVNMEDIDGKSLRAFLDDQFLSFPILTVGGSPGREQMIGGIPGLPTSFLVNPEGEVVAQQVGPVTAEGLRGFIEKYEKKKGG